MPLENQTILVTGQGYSVLEMIQAFETAARKPVPYDIVDRCLGDIAACYTDPSLAKQLLGCEVRLDINRMCADAWRWQSMNPAGCAVKGH